MPETLVTRLTRVGSVDTTVPFVLVMDTQQLEKYKKDYDIFIKIIFNVYIFNNIIKSLTNISIQIYN